MGSDSLLRSGRLRSCMERVKPSCARRTGESARPHKNPCLHNLAGGLAAGWNWNPAVAGNWAIAFVVEVEICFAILVGFGDGLLIRRAEAWCVGQRGQRSLCHVHGFAVGCA